MLKIAAKPTIFNGVLFRSNLEARWAAFFTKVGCYIEYEPAKYLMDRLWYVPDFYVKTPTGIDFFFEVKPNHAALRFSTKTQKTALWDFCKFVSKKTPHKNVVILMGDPESSFEFIVCTENSPAFGRRLVLSGSDVMENTDLFWRLLI